MPAGDGVLGADGGEAPRLQRAAGLGRTAAAGDGGNGCRVLTVDSFLLSRGADMSDHCGNEDYDDYSEYDSQTDSQGYRQRRVAAG